MSASARPRWKSLGSVTQILRKCDWQVCLFVGKKHFWDHARISVPSSLESNLEKDIQNLEKELSESKDIDSRNLLDSIDRNKRELEEIRQQKIEGVVLRSRARWVEYGEKPTSYFANLEKRNSVNKSIIHLQNSKGESLRNQDQIVEETLSFYRNLYESKDDKLNLEEFDQHLLRSDFPNLTEVKLRALEGRLSLGELLAALKKNPK